ncbi:MAG: hypothetical protein EA412_11545 [Chitinophagaceae bacterium]|nr:MAG: hypothetical protein EA412_11545 [Chitinophagaceae bacterium]
MSLLLIIATIELAYTVYLALVDTEKDTIILDLDNMLNIFGVFLLVLIGIELLDTIKVYFKENVIHVEVVMLVALIAIARKVIVLDFEEYSGFEILGISSVIIAISAGYYLIKKTGSTSFWPKEKKEVKSEVVEEKSRKGEKRPEKVKKVKTEIIEKPVADPEGAETDSEEDTDINKKSEEDKK